MLLERSAKTAESCVPLVTAASECGGFGGRHAAILTDCLLYVTVVTWTAAYCHCISSPHWLSYFATQIAAGQTFSHKGCMDHLYGRWQAAYSTKGTEFIK